MDEPTSEGGSGDQVGKLSIKGSGSTQLSRIGCSRALSFPHYTRDTWEVMESTVLSVNDVPLIKSKTKLSGNSLFVRSIPQLYLGRAFPTTPEITDNPIYPPKLAGGKRGENSAFSVDSKVANHDSRREVGRPR